MRFFPYTPILISLFFVVCTCAEAQQTAFLNQYSWNPRLFNPARQGGDGGEISVAYRSQFQELEPAIRPTTYLVHADISPFSGKRIGVGIQALADNTHILRRNQFSGFFGYHLMNQGDLRLSLGVMAGVLIQHFDFSEVRVSDVLDLFVFNNQTNATRFDGGPGLSFEYRTSGGSFFALDAAAPQLFSSDIVIEKPEGATREGAVYDLAPHFLTNARFRFQGNGFAIEPALIFRALSGARPLAGGVYDINLNTYFLKNNSLLIGAGARSDKGGYHLQIGLAPTRNLRLHVSGEIHASLGMTYEAGAAFVFDRRTKNKPVAESGPGLDAVERAYADLRVALITLDPEISSIRNQQDEAGKIIESGARTSRKQKVLETDKCMFRLAQSGQDLIILQQRVNALDVQLKEAQVLARDLEVRGGVISESTQNDIRTTGELLVRAKKQVGDLEEAQNSLSQQCTALRPEITEAACLQDKDATCVEELFTQNLEAVPGRPENMFPLRVTMTGSTTLVTYHFPDDAETYTLSPESRRLAGHIADQVQKITGQGLVLDRIILETTLQEDSVTLGYRPGQQYAGEFGTTFSTFSLIDNETNKIAERTINLEPNAEVTLEELALLKITALQKNLAERGIPANKITIQVRYNRSENVYREETRIMLRIR